MASWYGGIGDGQRVTKRETIESESSLKVEQKRIMSGASLKAYGWLILTAILIGPDLGVAAGYVALALGLVKLVRSNFVQRAYYRRWRGWLLLAVGAGLGVLWYLHGWYLVKSVWMPVYFYDSRLYVADRRLILFPTWLRAIIIGAVAATITSELALTAEMWIELFDSNWPPTYEPRESYNGPWNPLKRRGGRPPEEGGEQESEPGARAREGQVGLEIWAPVNEHTDRDELERIRDRDAKRRHVDQGNGNGHR